MHANDPARVRVERYVELVQLALFEVETVEEATVVADLAFAMERGQRQASYAAALSLVEGLLADLTREPGIALALTLTREEG